MKVANFNGFCSSIASLSIYLIPQHTSFAAERMKAGKSCKFQMKRILKEKQEEGNLMSELAQLAFDKKKEFLEL